MAAATTSSSFAGGASLLNTWDYKLSASSARSRDHPPPTLSPLANPAKLLYPPSTSHRVFPPPLAQRDFTVLKEVGDGSFGTVWLADWHSALELPAGTLPPGPSSRPEYKGKRLVAIKRMKKAFEGGWDECLKLKELKSLRQIPMHANIIPLYDAFLLPSTKELYFVFECMEGNLYQLTKSRKGRPLAAGLTASLFYQILAGLDHIHQSGYFHRDMKPENLLITTTGLADYPASSLTAPVGAPTEKDVVVVVKLADFGLARETNSSAAILTEYVSTRWYRAPEVLLRSRDYSNPVDMWALGTILVEMITLKPLFPGDSEVDQVYKICEVLGDPSSEYGLDERRRVKGGGPWGRGVKMAKEVGFAFPKMTPRNLSSLFDATTVPFQLVDCIADLLRFEPMARLTTQECLDHAYFRDVAYRFAPYDARTASQSGTPDRYAQSSSVPSTATQSPRALPPSHSNGTPAYRKPRFEMAGDSSRTLPPPNDSPHQSTKDSYYSPTPARSLYAPSEDSAMHFQEHRQQSPSQSSIWSVPVDPHWGPLSADQQSLEYRPIPAFGSHHTRRGSYSGSVAASTFYDGSIFEGIAPSRASSIMSFPIGYGTQDSPPQRFPNYSDDLSRQLGLQHSLQGTTLNSPQGSTLELPPPRQQQQQQQQQQAAITKSRSWGFSSVFNGNGAAPSASSSNPLKRSPSTSSVHPPAHDLEMPRAAPLDPKKAKKEAEKIAKETEKVRRDAMAMASRERARAVMRKKNQLMEAADPLNNYSNQLRTPVPDKGKARASASTINPGGTGPHGVRMPQIVEDSSRLHVSEMRHKTRRRDVDEDVHSVSSGETGHSSQRGGRPFSVSSQATSASEPDIRSGAQRQRIGGSSRPHHSHYYGPPPSTGHSSLDHQLIDDMRGLATSGEPDWQSPVRSDPRGPGRVSPSLREVPLDARFSPYPGYAGRPGQHNLPAIDLTGHLRRPSGRPASSASLVSSHSAPGTLPSHWDLPFLPSMALDAEPSPSTTFPYQTSAPR